MPEILKGVRNFLARHVTREIKVFKVEDFKLDPPEIFKPRTRVDTLHLYPKIEAASSKPFDFDNRLECKATRLKFSDELIKSKNVKIKKYIKQDVKAHKISFSKKIKTWSNLKQVQAMPQERKNLLKLLKKKIAVANNEMILAYYGQIVEGAVTKLVLNKQRGTLLIWYNPGSRQFKARGVYLIRKLGMGTKPEWRWV